MKELTFDVNLDEDGRLVAEAQENGIATDGATWEELRANVQSLIAAHQSELEKRSVVNFLEIDAVA